MYWLDYKIPKKFNKIHDKYSKMFVEYLAESGVNMTRTRTFKASNSVSCFILNLDFSMSSDGSMVITLDKNSYSRKLIYDCVEVNRKVSYNYSIKMFEWLVVSGLVTMDVGGIVDWCNNGEKVVPKTTKPTTLYLSDTILNDYYSTTPTKQHKTLIPSVMELRDENGYAITKRKGPDQTKKCRMLNNLNMLAKNTNLESNGKAFDISFKSVYNLDFTKGGRTYVVGGDCKVIEKDIRELLVFDGEETIELDFKSLHARMVATLLGHGMPPWFDPYQIQIDGYDPQVLRTICKLIMLCAFNAKNRREAISAVSSEINNIEYATEDNNVDIPARQYWYENKLAPKHIEIGYIADKLFEHNRFLMSYAYTGCGLELQNLDSRIMDIIVSYFVDKGEFVLPIHDSIVCRKSLQEEAIKIMLEAYTQVMGDGDNCIVEVKC